MFCCKKGCFNSLQNQRVLLEKGVVFCLIVNPRKTGEGSGGVKLGCEQGIRFVREWIHRWRLYLRSWHNRKTQAPRYIHKPSAYYWQEFWSLIGIIWSTGVWNNVEQKAYVAESFCLFVSSPCDLIDCAWPVLTAIALARTGGNPGHAHSASVWRVFYL